MRFMVKIIEAYRLEKIFKTIESNPALPIPAVGVYGQHYTMSINTRFICLLNISRISGDI